MKQFKLSWFVFYKFVILFVCVGVNEPNFVDGMSLDRYSTFDTTVKRKYDELRVLNNQDLVDCFCSCSIQGDRSAVDSEICSALDKIAGNRVGKETLLIVTARLYPFVECARTLNDLVNKIPVTQVVGREKISKAKKVVLLMDALGVQGEDVVACFSNFCMRLNKLKKDPIIFPDASEKYKAGSLLKIFTCDACLGDKKQKQHFIIDQINSYWDVQAKSVVDNLLPLLRFGMFSLELGPTRYEYDLSTHRYIISFSGRKISARCVTGPLLIDDIDSIKIPPICCLMDDREISEASGLHHEIFHHLVIGIEGDGFDSFSRLAVVFLREKIDSSYVRYLKDIYTDADEFRTITGLFVNDKGKLCFDPCSEGAYLHKEGRSLRGTHKSGFRAVHMPISLICLLEKYYGKLNLDYREKLDHGKIEWYN